MTVPVRRFFVRLCAAFGCILIAASLALIAYNLHTSARVGKAAAELVGRLYGQIGASQTLSGREEEAQSVLLDGEPYLGILSVPALGLELPVLDKYSESGLRSAPCRYSGFAESGDLVLAGHNYASQFGALERLKTGEEIVLLTAGGRRIVYHVAYAEVLEPTQVEEMCAHDPAWDLTLFTCTISGRTRFTLRCERIGA